MTVYGLVGSGSFLCLIASGFTDLWYVCIIGILLGSLLTLKVVKVNQTAIRNVTGGSFAVAALTLTAPAMWIVTHVQLDIGAVVAWITHIMFFLSGVTFVNMLIDGRGKSELNLGEYYRTVFKTSTFYHILLFVTVTVPALHVSGLTGLLFWLAFFPLWLRQVWGQKWISTAQIPSFKKIGLLETAWTIWFSLLIVTAALRYTG